MTDINLRVLALTLSPEPVPASASFTVQAFRGIKPYRSLDVDAFIFSPQNPGNVPAGSVKTISLPATDGTFYYKWTIFPPDGQQYSRYTTVPVSSDTIPFEALPDIDPLTMVPTEDVVAEWRTVRDAALQYRNEAEDFSDLAEQSKVQAQNAQFSAETASADAISARDDAQAAETNSEVANTSAQAAKNSAISARAGAEDAKVAAETSRTDAETARTGAETARIGAETANTNAQNAKVAAETARVGAETAQTGAQTARTGAETARTGAEAAKTSAEMTAQSSAFLYVTTADVTGVLDLSSYARNVIVHRRLIGNITGVTFPTTPYAGQTLTLILSQDTTGSRTLVTPASVFTSYGLDPVLSTAAGSVDVLHFWYDGVRWWAFVGALGGA